MMTLNKLAGLERWLGSDIYIFIWKAAPSSSGVTFPPVGVVNSSPIGPKESMLRIDIIQPNPGIKSGIFHVIGDKCWKKVSQDNL